MNNNSNHKHNGTDHGLESWQVSKDCLECLPGSMKRFLQFPEVAAVISRAVQLSQEFHFQRPNIPMDKGVFRRMAINEWGMTSKNFDIAWKIGIKTIGGCHNMTIPAIVNEFGADLCGIVCRMEAGTKI